MTIIFSQIQKFFESVIKNKPKKFLAVDFMNLADFNNSTKVVYKYINDFDIGFFGLGSKDKALIKELKSLSEKKNKLFIVTLGENGSIAFQKGKLYEQEATPVTKVIDTTGAGDAYAAVFLKEFLYTNNVKQSMESASKYAASVIQKVGAF